MPAAGVLDQHAQLGEGQEPNLLRVGDGGQLDAVARVDRRPAPLRRAGEREQRREGRDDVADGLGGEALALKHGDEVLDVVGGDRVERPRPEERGDVDAHLALDVLQRRGLAPAAAGEHEVGGRDLLDAGPLAAGAGGRGLADQLA